MCMCVNNTDNSKPLFGFRHISQEISLATASKGGLLNLHYH